MRSRNERSKSTAAPPDAQQLVHLVQFEDLESERLWNFSVRPPQTQPAPSKPQPHLSHSQPQCSLQNQAIAPLRTRKFSTPTALLERREDGALLVLPAGGGGGTGATNAGGTSTNLPSTRFPIISECETQLQLQFPKAIDIDEIDVIDNERRSNANAGVGAHAYATRFQLGRPLECRPPQSAPHPVEQLHFRRLVRNSTTASIKTVASVTTFVSSHSSTSSAAPQQHQAIRLDRLCHRSLSGASSLVDGSVYVSET